MKATYTYPVFFKQEWMTARAKEDAQTLPVWHKELKPFEFSLTVTSKAGEIIRNETETLWMYGKGEAFMLAAMLSALPNLRGERTAATVINA